MLSNRATDEPPSMLILAGPNGAGKSTLAPHLLRDHLGIRHFVNADVIAQGLSGYSPEAVAIEAGKIMLRRIAHLIDSKESFAIETTLAGRNYLKVIERAKQSGFLIHLIFIWLRTVDIAVDRVENRVRFGGHDIPTETIRRRYTRGLTNFVDVYQYTVTSWEIIETEDCGELKVIAFGSKDDQSIINDAAWNLITGTADA